MNRFSTILGLFCACCLAPIAQGAFDEPFQNGPFDADLSGWSIFPEPQGEEDYVLWDEETSAAMLAPYVDGEESLEPADTNSILSQQFLLSEEIVQLSFDVTLKTAGPGTETDVLYVTLNGDPVYQFSSSQVNQAALDADPLITSAYVDADGCVQKATYATVITADVTAYAGGNVTLSFRLFNDNGDTCVTHCLIDNVQLIADTTPPTVTPGPMLELWPPNHKYVTFSLSDCVSVMDNIDGQIDVDQVGKILSIYSDEPEDVTGNGDGNTDDDIIIVSDGTFMVLAERQGDGDGRVYGVSFQVADQRGNLAQSIFYLGVPHDQSGDAAVDSGASAGYTVYNN